MSSTGTAKVPPGDGGDDHDLAEFGYKPSLDRSIGKFASFAAGVSYISILTGTFQLFYFGFGTAGPAYLWSWPMVFAGQLMVALCFMELGAKYPVAGSVYNWAKTLGSRVVGWSAGWLMLTASIVTLSAVVLALQINLPRIWPGFQIIGDGSGSTFAANAVLLGSIMIILTTVINALGVRLMAMINSAGVFIELIAAVLIAVLLALRQPGSAGLLLHQRLRRGGERWVPQSLPDRLARLRLRDVRLRHGQLVGPGVLAILILVINVGQPQIFTVLTSIAIIMTYLAYLMVTAPMLKKRLTGEWPPKDLTADGYFSLGRWGLPVNVLAVLWGIGMAVNLAWSREAVYGTPWYNTWGAFLYIGVILGSGLLWFAIKGRHSIGTLASHAVEARTAPDQERVADGEQA